MGRAKLVLRIVGIASTMVGVVCFPAGFGLDPRRDSSAFNNLADTGMFVTLGLVLIAAGVVTFAASWLLPGPEPEDFL